MFNRTPVHEIPDTPGLLGQHVPDQNRKLASHCNGSDLVAASGPDPDEERVQRSRRFRCRPCGLHQHGPRMAAADLADASVMSNAKSRLPNPRIARRQSR